MIAVRTWGIFSSYGGDGPSNIMFVQRRQNSYIVGRNTSEFSSRLGRAIYTLLQVRRETTRPFPVVTGILGFLSIFKKSQASSPLEALNSMCLLKFHRDARPPVQMRRGPSAFSRVSTGDSGSPSSCEMKDEPALKPLKGNPAFFRARASRFPLHLR